MLATATAPRVIVAIRLLAVACTDIHEACVMRVGGALRLKLCGTAKVCSIYTWGPGLRGGPPQ
jgi:hypothetical protein